MEKILQSALLYDFYSGLLTEKQRRFFELYYFDNLSTLEIGEANSVTPQAVWELLKRTQKILDRYEEKLGMVEKHLAIKIKVEEITKSIDIILNDSILNNENSENKDRLEYIKEIVAELY